MPLVPEFLANHPAIALDIVLADQVVDLLEQCADISLRNGPPKDSQLLARKLGTRSNAGSKYQWKVMRRSAVAKRMRVE
ncbi:MULTISPECIES: LysR substrate-binding domain-containing protein [Paraburkholderia]|uniref:LysR substrate-binding domain-containing protein n=1 Tax=Paraburkholderia TaxID=1822464 RepID=UPI0022537C2F|nr:MULTISPECIES: LysR substrate-binding domain-containing protein [Paraburkholderia]MCX4157111.1 LysR substrate-binding domain-containing protein [Paraburkholderia aspalathi]